jgi:Tfp pilus assembly PilM family ATPase
MSQQTPGRPAKARGPRCLAIDLDPQGLFVASGTPAHIEQVLAWVPGDDHGPPALTLDNAKEIGEQLRDRLASASIPANKVLIGIGRDKVILKEVRYPPVPPEQEPAVVQFQVAKDLTESADEVVIDYVPIEDVATALGDERRSMTVVLRKDVLAAIQTMCLAAGLKVAAVTPRPFAIAAVFSEALAKGTAPALPAADAAVAVLTIGPAGGEFTVLRRGQVSFARSIPAPSLVNETLLLAEIRRNLTVYNGQNPGDGISAVYVAEAQHHIGGWAGKLDGNLPVPVHTFDPLEQSSATAPEKLHGRFAGAAGLLALKADEVLPINFASPRQPRAAADPKRRQLVLVALASLALIIGGGGFGYLEYVKADRRLTTHMARKAALETEIKGRETDAKRLDAADQWSKRSVNYLDELFDMSARLPEGDQVRFIEFKGTPRPVDKAGKQDAQATLEIRGGVRIGSAVTALADEIENDNLGKQKYYIGTRITRPGHNITNTAYNQPFTITTMVNHRGPAEYTEAPAFTPPVRRPAAAPPAAAPASAAPPPTRKESDEKTGGMGEGRRRGGNQ